MAGGEDDGQQAATSNGEVVPVTADGEVEQAEQGVSFHTV